jgi:hypothetical protein
LQPFAESSNTESSNIEHRITMKNLISVFLTVLAATLLLPSCKKTYTTPDPVIITRLTLIHTVAVTDTTGKFILGFTLEYDEQGRLVKVKETFSPSDTMPTVYEYSYTGNRVEMNCTYPSYPWNRHWRIYYLNTRGLADSLLEYAVGGSDTVSYLYTYTWDEKGYLLTRSVHSSEPVQWTETCHYAGLNLESLTVTPASSTGGWHYSYDPAHTFTLAFENAGLPFLGRTMVNPVLHAQSDSIPAAQATLWYEYDTYGRISRITNDGAALIPGTDYFTLPLVLEHGVITYTYY